MPEYLPQNGNDGNGHVCSMHELMERRVQQLGEMIQNGQYDPKSRAPLPFRVYHKCIDCKADYDCDFYRKEVMQRRRLAGKGNAKPDTGGVEKMIS